MTAQRVAAMALGCLLVSWVPAWAESESDPAALAAVVQAGDEALSRGDVDGMMKTMHSQAPAFFALSKAFKELFDAGFKLTQVSSGFRIVGHYQEYVVMGATTTVTKVSGPAFKNNTQDVLYVFKQEGHEWKIWQHTVLSTKLLEQ